MKRIDMPSGRFFFTKCITPIIKSPVICRAKIIIYVTNTRPVNIAPFVASACGADFANSGNTANPITPSTTKPIAPINNRIKPTNPIFPSEFRYGM